MYIHFKFPPNDQVQIQMLVLCSQGCSQGFFLQENSKTHAVLPVIPTLYQSKRAKAITSTEEVQKMPDDVLWLDMNFSMFIPHKHRYKHVYTWPLKDSTVHRPLTVASSLKLALGWHTTTPPLWTKTTETRLSSQN